MQGRKPTPLKNIKKHLTHAEIETRTAQEASVKPKMTRIGAPGWLDKMARSEWTRIIGELKRLELISNIDVAALAICCDAYSKYMKATADIDKVGLLINITDKKGNTTILPNPLITIANKYADIYKKYCVDFGLTPIARLRLAVCKDVKPEEVDESKWAKYKTGINNFG
jgi:P27 family predicted phage terminase small subunit